MRLKFGKVGLLFLALVISLAGIGGAFAAWTTEVKFEGQVNTGHLTFEIEDYSGTEAWKVTDEDGNEHAIEILRGWSDALGIGNLQGSPNPNVKDDQGNPIPVGKAFAREGGENEADVVFEYVNLFPCVEWCADFLLHYTGTVPVIVTAEIGTEAPWLQWLWDNGYVEVKVYESDADGVPGPAIDLFDGFWQMHLCDYVVVEVCIKIPQTHPEGEFNNFQGQTGSFSGRIHAIQWNKYENGNGIDWAITSAIAYEPGQGGSETAWALCCLEGETCPDCGEVSGWGQWFTYDIGDAPITKPIYAGQYTLVGELRISTNVDKIYIEYVMTEPDEIIPDWAILETHLWLSGTELEGDPEEWTNQPEGGLGTWPFTSGNPPDGVTLTMGDYSHKWAIPISWLEANVMNGGPLYITAAHATVATEGESDYMAWPIVFDDPTMSATLGIPCLGYAYTWFVDFTVKNTGGQAIEITGTDVSVTGDITATPISNIDGEVLLPGEELLYRVQVDVGACELGPMAGYVTLNVYAEAA